MWKIKIKAEEGGVEVLKYNRSSVEVLLFLVSFVHNQTIYIVNT